MNLMQLPRTRGRWRHLIAPGLVLGGVLYFVVFASKEARLCQICGERRHVLRLLSRIPIYRWSESDVFARWFNSDPRCNHSHEFVSFGTTYLNPYGMTVGYGSARIPLSFTWMPSKRLFLFTNYLAACPLNAAIHLKENPIARDVESVIMANLESSGYEGSFAPRFPQANQPQIDELVRLLCKSPNAQK